jgi:hypothetical protein
MFRRNSIGRKRHNAAQCGRAGPLIRGSRGDPDAQPKIRGNTGPYIRLEELDELLTNINQKERKL